MQYLAGGAVVEAGAQPVLDVTELIALRCVSVAGMGSTSQSPRAVTCPTKVILVRAA